MAGEEVFSSRTDVFSSSFLKRRAKYLEVNSV